MGQSKWGLVCALSTVLVAGRLVAQEANYEQRTPRSAEERIELQLKQPLKTPLEFVETPLNGIMDAISEEYDFPIQFDTAALDAVAASPETEVTANLRNVSLRSALDLIFRGTEDLTYIVDNEVLLITTEDEAQTRLEVRVYRVDDLVSPEPGGALLAVDADYDSLVDMIVSNVEGDSWAENGTGEGEIQAFPPGMLVISQTSRVHEQIGLLFEALRSTKAAILADADEAGEGRMVTRGVAIDESAAKTEAAQNSIRNVLMRSVDWEAKSADVQDQVLLNVLPTRILVRHRPSVVQQVLYTVDKLALEPRTSTFGGGRSAGGGGGLGGGESQGGDGTATPATQPLPGGQASGGGGRGGF
jgi:hypothetical protein